MYNSTIINPVIDEMKLNNYDRLRTTCPSCHARNTLTCTYNEITNEYIFNCYRNSCGFKGKVRGTGNMNVLNRARINREARQGIISSINTPTHLIDGVGSKEALEWLVKNNAIDAYHQGLYKIYTDLREDRIVVPLYHNSKRINFMGRAWNKTTIPKVRIYDRDSIVPPFTVGTGTTLVLVEDFASAANIASMANHIGFALLGTQFKLEKYLPYIQELSPTRIIVALDRDAIIKGQSIVNSLQSVFNVVELLPITKDIKYYTQQELEETFL